MKFSERMGLTQVRSVLQVDSISESLKIRLWNNFKDNFLNEFPGEYEERTNLEEEFAKIFWKEYLIKVIDDIPKLHNGYINDKLIFEIFRKTLFGGEWFEFFDLIEYITPFADHLKTSFIQEVNKSLEKEISGYRIIDKKIVRITSESEIIEIEEAISGSDEFNSVNLHLRTALEYLSNRENPDYRNSIKESISSVEAFCKIIVGNDKNTLGDALKILKSKHNLHPALEKSFLSLYGYTNDAGGIRHSLSQEDQEIKFEDAKLILVTCSAFINYLKAKFITS